MSDIKFIVNETLTTIDHFGALLQRETEALGKRDFGTVDNLQTDKRNLARDYQALVATLAEQRDAVLALDTSTRERLIRARTRFTEILTENTQALQHMKKSSQRLVDRILDIARQAATEATQTGYSSGGHVQSYKTSSSALSLDQSL